MAKRFLTPIRLLNLSSDPESANEGDIYYNTASDSLKLYANSVWTDVSSGGGGSSVTISDTAPSSPSSGDLWYESDTLKLYIYYDSFWVEVDDGDGLPDQTGNSGKFLTTNGTTPSWSTIQTDAVSPFLLFGA